MVNQHAWRSLGDFALQQLAVDAHLICWQDTLTDVGWFAIHRHAPGNDQIFHVTTRSQAGLGEHLVQFGGVVLRRQVAAGLVFDWLAGRLAAGIGVVIGIRGDKGEYIVRLWLLRCLR